jgi:hypothetical protein
LPSFRAAPKPTFAVLNKLDLAFSSLLTGTNAETGETLYGSGLARGTFNMTEKVRLKSLVDQTRLDVIKTIEGEMSQEDDSEPDEAGSLYEDIDHIELHTSRIYDRTVTELGVVLGSTPIGIHTME